MTIYKFLSIIEFSFKLFSFSSRLDLNKYENENVSRVAGIQVMTQNRHRYKFQFICLPLVFDPI